MDKWCLALGAVIVIGCIEIVALLCGIDGIVLGASMAAIGAIVAGTIGYGAGRTKYVEVVAKNLKQVTKKL